MKLFLKKNWGNLALLVIIILLFIPQTGTPIKVVLNRYLAFSPSAVPSEDRKVLEDYDWPLQTLEGGIANLRASEGKVAVINVWATWCSPCVAELPSFQNLYNEYGDRVDFYFVSAESPEILKRFLEKKEYDLPIYLYGHEVPEPLATRSLPTTYVLSKTGKLVVDKTGAARWDSKKVANLLDTLLAE